MFVVAVGGGGVDWDLTDGVDVLISRPVGDSILAAKRNVQSPVFGVQVGVIEAMCKSIKTHCRQILLAPEA